MVTEKLSIIHVHCSLCTQLVNEFGTKAQWRSWSKDAETKILVEYAARKASFVFMKNVSCNCRRHLTFTWPLSTEYFRDPLNPSGELSPSATHGRLCHTGPLKRMYV